MATNQKLEEIALIRSGLAKTTLKDYEALEKLTEAKDPKQRATIISEYLRQKARAMN